MPRSGYQFSCRQILRSARSAELTEKAFRVVHYSIENAHQGSLQRFEIVLGVNWQVMFQHIKRIFSPFVLGLPFRPLDHDIRYAVAYIWCSPGICRGHQMLRQLCSSWLDRTYIWKSMTPSSSERTHHVSVVSLQAQHVEAWCRSQASPDFWFEQAGLGRSCSVALIRSMQQRKFR